MDKIMIVTNNIENVANIERELKLVTDDIIIIDKPDDVITEVNKNFEYDLLVIDYHYFSEEIINTCSIVRKKKTRYDLPILLLLDELGDECLRNILDIGVNDIILKPYNFIELNYRIKNLINIKNSINEALNVSMRSKLLKTISNILSSTLDIDNLLQKVIKLTVDVTGASSGSIFLLNEKGQIVRKVLSEDFPKNKQKEILGSIMNFGLAGWVYKEKKVGLVSDTKEDNRWLSFQTASKEIRSAVCVPIIRRDSLLGVFTLHQMKPNYFNNGRVDILKQIADQASISIENARLFAHVQKMAITDYLTGLYNRRLFFTFAEKEFHKSKRFKEPISILMIDIDHFKNINDQYGHQVGDSVLIELAEIFKKHVRLSDFLARFGGEEFILLMLKTDSNGAFKLAERLREEVENKKFNNSEGNSINLTISIGIAELNENNDELFSLIKRSDDALYIAKNKGRNKIVTSNK